MKGLTKVYSEGCQPSKVEFFGDVVNSFQPLTIFAKRSILDVWQGSEYASAQWHFHKWCDDFQSGV